MMCDTFMNGCQKSTNGHSILINGWKCMVIVKAHRYIVSVLSLPDHTASLLRFV